MGATQVTLDVDIGSGRQTFFSGALAHGQGYSQSHYRSAENNVPAYSFQEYPGFWNSIGGGARIIVGFSHLEVNRSAPLLYIERGEERKTWILLSSIVQMHREKKGHLLPPSVYADARS